MNLHPASGSELVGESVSLGPGSVIGRYVVVRKLAEGGMAEIFLASAQGPEGFEKEVVIKRIRPVFANDPSFVQMFIEEARVVSRLNHANIVQIIDFDRHEETYYLAMEYVRGRSLSEAHKRARELSVPLTPVLVAQIGQEVARGLGFAHRLSDQGRTLELVHRDVTPHNILLSYDGAVKLTDFGIAKASNRATTAGMLKGKFAYMSPEQAKGERLDLRTDLFALGVTLWELLTGGRLFDGESDLAVLRAVQEREVLAPSLLNPEVDTEFDEAIMRALRRDPKARYQSAQEFERALSHFILRHARSPEDADVGAWMRELFPVEAKRAEPSVSRSSPRPAPGAVQKAPLAAGPRRSEARPLAGPGLAGAVGAPPIDPAAFAATQTGRNETVENEVREVSSRTPITVTPVTRAPVVPTFPASVRAALERAKQWYPGHRRSALAAGGALLLLAVVLVTWSIARRTPSTADVTGGTGSGAAAKERPLDLQLSPMRRLELPPPAPAIPEPVVKPATDPGKLVLTVIPWASVYVDGKLVRQEHVGTHEYVLSPGPHHIVLKGAKPAQFDVDIQPGDTVSQRIRLR